jgi:hypothetical protein
MKGWGLIGTAIGLGMTMNVMKQTGLIPKPKRRKRKRR